MKGGAYSSWQSAGGGEKGEREQSGSWVTIEGSRHIPRILNRHSSILLCRNSVISWTEQELDSSTCLLIKSVKLFCVDTCMPYPAIIDYVSLKDNRVDNLRIKHSQHSLLHHMRQDRICHVSPRLQIKFWPQVLLLSSVIFSLCQWFVSMHVMCCKS